MANDPITLDVVLEHVLGIGQSVDALSFKMDQRFNDVDMRFEALEKRLDNKIDALQFNLTRQIDAIDKRLDAVEIEYLPKRVSRIEKHLKLPKIKELAQA